MHFFASYYRVDLRVNGSKFLLRKCCGPGQVYHISSVEGQLVEPRSLVPVHFSVSPVAWSHALNCCQAAFRDVVGAAVPQAVFLSDHSPSPNLCNGAVAVYVDGFAALSTDPNIARDIGSKIFHEAHTNNFFCEFRNFVLEPKRKVCTYLFRLLWVANISGGLAQEPK